MIPEWITPEAWTCMSLSAPRVKAAALVYGKQMDVLN